MYVAEAVTLRRLLEGVRQKGVDSVGIEFRKGPLPDVFQYIEPGDADLIASDGCAWYFTVRKGDKKKVLIGRYLANMYRLVGALGV